MESRDSNEIDPGSKAGHAYDVQEVTNEKKMIGCDLGS